MQNKMMGTIELEQMEFYAYHGCFREEQLVGNKFTVDISFAYNCMEASISDSISNAINYTQIFDIVKTEMMIPSHLLEHLASRILNNISQEFSNIEKLSVKVSKINPPVGGQMRCVSVTLNQ